MAAATRRDPLARRAFLSLWAAPLLPASPGDSSAGRSFPSEWRRYPDPATELEVTRFTDPSHSSFLPAYHQRCISKRGTSLLYWSDRTGSPQAFQMDLKSGESRQLTEAGALDGSSLTLARDDRGFHYFDGRTLCYSDFGKLRVRELYQVPAGFERTAGFHASEDGAIGVFAERQANTSRLRGFRFGKGGISTIVQADWEISDPVMRPRRDQVLYRRDEGALWLVNLDGKQHRPLKSEPGAIGPWRWTPSGRTVAYLHFPAVARELNTLRECVPDENSDKLLAKTSQFVHFGCNGDSSVFVGASRNQSSPYILLLLRVTRRELSLCEHKASDPAMVAPIFSPNSQNVVFVSDRHGKPAIYRIKIEKFVEETDEESS